MAGRQAVVRVGVGEFRGALLGFDRRMGSFFSSTDEKVILERVSPPKSTEFNRTKEQEPTSPCSYSRQILNMVDYR